MGADEERKAIQARAWELDAKRRSGRPSLESLVEALFETVIELRDGGPDEILTIAEAAEESKLSASTLYRIAVEAGEDSPFAKRGGRWLTTRRQLLEWVESGPRHRRGIGNPMPIPKKRRRKRKKDSFGQLLKEAEDQRREL